MAKIRDVGKFAFGLLLMYGTISIIIFGYSISLINIIFLLGGIFLIFESILEHKTEILYLSLGFAILISAFIWIITQSAFLSKESLIGITMGISFFILGIRIHSGYISE